MNKKGRGLIFLIVLVSIALASIIVIQFYWMGNAYELRKREIHVKANFVLEKIKYEIYNVKDDLNPDNLLCDPLLIRQYYEEHLCISQKTLDSIVRKNVAKSGLSFPVVYALVDANNNDKVLYLSDSSYSKGRVIGGGHWVALSFIQSLLSQRNLCLYIYFPEEENDIFKSFLTQIILSFLFLTILVLGFAIAMHILFREKRFAQMKEDFVKNVTHEFNTPLSAIALASDMLLRNKEVQGNSILKKYITVIKQERLKLNRHMEHVLKLTMLEDDEAKKLFHVFDIQQLLQENIETFKMLAENKGGEIQTDFKAVNTLIKGDDKKIRTVISNLLDNALKYSPNKPLIKILTYNQHDNFYISVQDHGIGINKANQKIIFRKLVRVRTGNIHDVKGFGLGLFYVKEIVEEHGGTIIVKSDIGKGSKFTIKLPCVK